MAEHSMEYYYRLFTDLWKIFRKHAGMKNRQEDIEQLLEDISLFDRRYQSEFASGMAGVVMLELERRMKSQRRE